MPANPDICFQKPALLPRYESEDLFHNCIWIQISSFIYLLVFGADILQALIRGFHWKIAIQRLISRVSTLVNLDPEILS